MHAGTGLHSKPRSAGVERFSVHLRDNLLEFFLILENLGRLGLFLPLLILGKEVKSPSVCNKSSLRLRGTFFRPAPSS